MLTVFLSYARNSSRTASTLNAVFVALGARVFNYKLPNAETATNRTTLDRIRSECRAAQLFVQLLEDDLGTAKSDKNPLMVQELQWFLESDTTEYASRSKPLLLVIGSPGSVVQAHIAEYFERTDCENCADSDNAVEVATGWLSRLRPLESATTKAIRGHMDLEIGLPLVDEALGDALFKQELIPQKLLYTTPFGALFWRFLANNPESSVRRLYDAVDFDNEKLEPVTKIASEVATWDPRHPISIIALGCGDGRREAILTRRFVRNFPGREIRILLVDISKTLIGMAARRFAGVRNQHNVNMQIEFALADFEHPMTLSSLMGQWEPDRPVIVLFLGNTLGNINISSFISSVSNAMKPEDLLLTEITMAPTGQDGPPAERGKWMRISPQYDDRFKFLTGPIRELGIKPEIKNFRIRLDDEELSVRSTYAYAFHESEAKSVRSILNYQQVLGRLLLLRVDAFHADPLVVELSKTLAIQGGRVSTYPVRGIPGQEMGLFVAHRPR